MFYPESDIILKSNPSLSSEIIRFDTYIAALDKKEAKRLNPDFILSKLGLSASLFKEIVRLYIDAGVITEQNWYFCNICLSFICLKVLTEETVSCVDCEVDLDDKQVKTAYVLNKVYYQPDDSKESDYQPNPSILIENFQR
ncbi:MAG TPA: hypothetical protein V6C52_11360, partial [Coleofasciculaceae cyanobacterium]